METDLEEIKNTIDRIFGDSNALSYSSLMQEKIRIEAQLIEKDKEIERLQGRLEIQVGIVDTLEKDVEDIKDNRYA